MFVRKWKPFDVVFVQINFILNIFPVSLGQKFSVFTVSTGFFLFFFFFLAMFIRPNKNNYIKKVLMEALITAGLKVFH